MKTKHLNTAQITRHKPAFEFLEKELGYSTDDLIEMVLWGLCHKVSNVQLESRELKKLHPALTDEQVGRYIARQLDCTSIIPAQSAAEYLRGYDIEVPVQAKEVKDEAREAELSQVLDDIDSGLFMQVD